ALVQRRANFVARHGNDVRTFCAPLHLDVPRLRELPIDHRWITGDVPSALFCGNVLHGMTASFFMSGDFPHGDLFDLSAPVRTDRRTGRPRLTTKLGEQSSRNDYGPANDHRSRRNDTAHAFQFAFTRSKSSCKLLRLAAQVVWLQPWLLAGFHVEIQ